MTLENKQMITDVIAYLKKSNYKYQEVLKDLNQLLGIINDFYNCSIYDALIARKLDRTLRIKYPLIIKIESYNNYLHKNTIDMKKKKIYRDPLIEKINNDCLGIICDILIENKIISSIDDFFTASLNYHDLEDLYGAN